MDYCSIFGTTPRPRLARGGGRVEQAAGVAGGFRGFSAGDFPLPQIVEGGPEGLTPGVSAVWDTRYLEDPRSRVLRRGLTPSRIQTMISHYSYRRITTMSANTTDQTPADVLISTDVMELHLGDPSVVVVESNEDLLLYDTGHLPGAHHVDWRRDLNDALIRNYITPDEFARLAGRLGLTPETTVVFYGDKSNLWAAYALWVFHLFGHTRTRLLDGAGRNGSARGDR